GRNPTRRARAQWRGPARGSRATWSTARCRSPSRGWRSARGTAARWRAQASETCRARASLRPPNLASVNHQIGSCSDTSGGRESGVKFSQGPVTCQANRDVITVIYAAARRVVRLARAAEIYSGHGGGVHEALPAATRRVRPHGLPLLPEPVHEGRDPRPH